jgi:S-adenosyl-L-methionine hydrolase (adenosine-forming)
VVAAAAPGVAIIDLTHQIPVFDIRAGSRTLVRAAPYLGPGVVLAVVDPGVGSRRRSLCVAVDPPERGPSFFVGPDNGILIAAAELVGEAPIARAFELIAAPGESNGATTFDGRDLFAPAAAALCCGVAPEELGVSVDPASLVRLSQDVVEHGHLNNGRRYVRTEVVWIDHFGNVQLAASTVTGLAAELPRTGAIGIRIWRASEADREPGAGTTLRRVETFAELAQGELGLLLDANGHWAVVAREAHAARALNAGPGDMVVLTW